MAEPQADLQAQPEQTQPAQQPATEPAQSAERTFTAAEVQQRLQEQARQIDLMIRNPTPEQMAILERDYGLTRKQAQEAVKAQQEQQASEALMTPEERKIAALEQKLAQLESAIPRVNQTATEAQQIALAQRYTNDWNQHLNTFLAEQPEIARDPELLEIMQNDVFGAVEKMVRTNPDIVNQVPAMMRSWVKRFDTAAQRRVQATTPGSRGRAGGGAPVPIDLTKAKDWTDEQLREAMYAAAGV